MIRISAYWRNTSSIISIGDWTAVDSSGHMSRLSRVNLGVHKYFNISPDRHAHSSYLLLEESNIFSCV